MAGRGGRGREETVNGGERQGAVQREGRSSWKSKEEVHRGGSAYYRLRGEEETLEGYTTFKMQRKKPKSGADLGASICTWKKRKKKEGNCTL